MCAVWSQASQCLRSTRGCHAQALPCIQAEPLQEEHPTLLLIRHKENSDNFDMGFDDVSSVSMTRTADIIEDAHQSLSACEPLSNGVCEVVEQETTKTCTAMGSLVDPFPALFYQGKVPLHRPNRQTTTLLIARLFFRL